MNDLVESTTLLISNGRSNPFATSLSVLKALSASLKIAAEKESNESLARSAEWIDLQTKNLSPRS